MAIGGDLIGKRMKSLWAISMKHRQGEAPLRFVTPRRLLGLLGQKCLSLVVFSILVTFYQAKMKTQRSVICRGFMHYTQMYNHLKTNEEIRREIQTGITSAARARHSLRLHVFKVTKATGNRKQSQKF
uniref:Uncharacterized protein n=1 Tax=Anser cygnoides TaxID=8845 RepID=A0A8B9EPZ5_ANSCY